MALIVITRRGTLSISCPEEAGGPDFAYNPRPMIYGELLEVIRRTGERIRVEEESRRLRRTSSGNGFANPALARLCRRARRRGSSARWPGR